VRLAGSRIFQTNTNGGGVHEPRKGMPTSLDGWIVGEGRERFGCDRWSVVGGWQTVFRTSQSLGEMEDAKASVVFLKVDGGRSGF